MHPERRAKIDEIRREHQSREENMHRANDILESATTQYQAEHPKMSREEAFGEVNKVNSEKLKREYNKNPNGTYTHKRKGTY